MASAKFNIFHWHITDDDSFPIQIDKFPGITEHGAFSKEEVYSKADVKDIVAFAQQLAIRIIPEFDNPGHSRASTLDPYFREVSLCHDDDGVTVVPDYGVINNPPPLAVLDPSKQKTYELIEGVL